jgi:hypothetical protein
MTPFLPTAPEPVVRGEKLWLTAWALILFVATLLVHTEHNAFPYFYHPDEAEKADQVLTGEWNFHHPMLLLTTTKAVVQVGHVERNPQAVTVTGRWVSAACTAGAVVALAFLAFVWRGWTASLATGGALLLHHQLFELAHYMKEDTALLLGLSLSFLAAYLFWEKPSTWRAAALGLAAAVAISGKYLGTLVLVIVLPVLWMVPGSKKARFAAFFGTMLVAFVIMNLPLLLQFDAFQKSFQREMDLVVHGQRGMTRSVPHAQYWSVFRDNSTPAMWVFLLTFLAVRWRDRRTLNPVQWMVIAFPFVFALMLSFSPKSNDRYFLPATALFTLLAGFGAVDAAKMLAHWIPRRWALAGCVTVLLVCQAVSLPSPLSWRTLSNYFAAFQRDDNAELLDWIKAELPPSAVIVKDSRVKLPDPRKKEDDGRYPPMPQKILQTPPGVPAAQYAADVGTMEELRAAGVTHVAVSKTDYGRFLDDKLRPQKSEAAKYAKYRAFYEELLRYGEPLFERPRGTVIYLHPGISVYPLPPPME